MGILKYAFGAGYRRFYDNISGIAESEKKNRFLLLADAAFCTLRYGSGTSPCGAVRTVAAGFRRPGGSARSIVSGPFRKGSSAAATSAL